MVLAATGSTVEVGAERFFDDGALADTTTVSFGRYEVCDALGDTNSELHGGLPAPGCSDRLCRVLYLGRLAFTGASRGHDGVNRLIWSRLRPVAAGQGLGAVWLGAHALRTFLVISVYASTTGRPLR